MFPVNNLHRYKLLNLATVQDSREGLIPETAEQVRDRIQRLLFGL